MGAQVTRPNLSQCDLGKPIAIIAGGGKLPEILANYIKDQGGAPFIFVVKDNATEAFEAFETKSITTGEIGTLLATLKRRNIKQLIMVGAINARPSLRDFRLDWPTIKLAKSIFMGVKFGDDALLSKLIAVLENENVNIFGVHDIMPSLLMPEGALFGKEPTSAQLKEIQIGMDAARALGALDTGQGCVVIGKRIVALEAAEGTDAMLRRVAVLREEGRLADKRSGVLVKVCKPQQDRRVDLPTIGAETIELAAKAKLTGVAISAQNALVVDVEDVQKRARDLNLFVYGAEHNG